MVAIQVPDEVAREIHQEAEKHGIPEAELIGKAWRAYRRRVVEEKIAAEARWWEEAPPELHVQYEGEYVAIHNQRVVDHDIDQATLYRRVRQQFGEIPVAIAPGQGLREIRIISSRIERI